MNENGFIKSVNDKLKGFLHFEKMHNPYRGGTADVWYSGTYDMWIEYKWLKSVPVKGKVKPKLRPLQRDWLRGRYYEGRNVCVVVGCPVGGMIFENPEQWELGLPTSQIRIMPKKFLVDWIKQYVGVTSETINVQSGKRSSNSTKSSNSGVQNVRNRIPAVRIGKVPTNRKGKP